jgi:hypothetical protein
MKVGRLTTTQARSSQTNHDNEKFRSKEDFIFREKMTHFDTRCPRPAQAKAFAEAIAMHRFWAREKGQVPA